MTAAAPAEGLVDPNEVQETVVGRVVPGCVVVGAPLGDDEHEASSRKSTPAAAVLSLDAPGAVSVISSTLRQVGDQS